MRRSSKEIRLIRHASLFVCFISLFSMPVISKEPSDWRSDYNAMIQASNIGNYDKSAESAKAALDKLLDSDNQTEKRLILEEIVRQLHMLEGQYKRQLNYERQEFVLRLLLKAAENKTDAARPYQIEQAKKRLAICLVMEGKSKEAEKYAPKGKRQSDEDMLQKGGNPAKEWMKELDLLTQANRDKDNAAICQSAKAATDKALAIRNAVEKNVAYTKILQQLQTAQFQFKNSKDYSNEEQILKLMLKIQQDQETKQNESAMTFCGGHPSANTLRELADCLVMQGKNDEATIYNTQYEEINKKAMQQVEDFQKNIQDQLLKLQQPKEKI